MVASVNNSSLGAYSRHESVAKTSRSVEDCCVAELLNVQPEYVKLRPYEITPSFVSLY